MPVTAGRISDAPSSVMPSTFSDSKAHTILSTGKWWVGRRFGADATSRDKHLAGMLVVSSRFVEVLTLHADMFMASKSLSFCRRCDWMSFLRLGSLTAAAENASILVLGEPCRRIAASPRHTQLRPDLAAQLHRSKLILQDPTGRADQGRQEVNVRNGALSQRAHVARP